MSGRRAGACRFPPRIGGASSRSNLLTACKVRDFSAKPSLAAATRWRFLFHISKKCKMDLADSQAKHYEAQEYDRRSLLPIPVRFPEALPLLALGS